MNVWLVTIGEPLPNAEGVKKNRTSLLAEKLLNRGHSVVLVASAFDHFIKKWIYNDDTKINISNKYSVHAIKGTGYNKNISINRLRDHRIIARKFPKIALSMSLPDIIVASMPSHDLAYQAVMFAKQNNIPVIVDIRDPWPDIFLQSFPLFFSKIAKVILYRDFFYVKKAMQYADALFATTSTMLDWGLKYAERTRTIKDKVFFLGQKKVSSHSGANTEESNEIKKFAGKFIIFFIGTVSHYHNPLILVDVAKKLDDCKDLHFVIAGDGILFNELKKQSQNLPNVTITGWLNDAQIVSWLRISKVGVCSTPKMIDLLPNKAGTYLSAGLPIISAFQGDLKSLIEKEQIGFYYSPRNANELADGIVKLYKDEVLYKRMSENAHNVFNNLFDADKVYNEYAEHIETVAKSIELN
jgi:glycosyltransferase involved in cell wall biosynthesis